MAKQTVTTMQDRAKAYIGSVMIASRTRLEADQLVAKAAGGLLAGIVKAFSGCTKLSHDDFKANVRPLILAEAKSAGIDEKSIATGLVRDTIAILAVANGYTPADGCENVKKFSDSVRAELVKAGIYQPANSGGKGRTDKPASDKKPSKGETAQGDVSKLSREGIAAFLVGGDQSDAMVVAKLSEPANLPMLRAMYNTLFPAK